MRNIKELSVWMEDELCSAKQYAENAVDFKIKNDTNWSNRFKAMAQAELEHASNLHSLASEEIDEAKAVITPPTEMVDAWEKSHARYVEKAAWVKQMLTL